MSPLYALYVTNAGRAVRELGEAGFECWAPTYKRLDPSRRVRRGPVPLVDAPLFPGYVFARIAPGRFAAALACERVCHVVGSGGIARPVPEHDFADLLLLVLSGKLDEREPGQRSRPRGNRAKGLASLQAWFAAASIAARRAA